MAQIFGVFWGGEMTLRVKCTLVFIWVKCMSFFGEFGEAKCVNYITLMTKIHILLMKSL